MARSNLVSVGGIVNPFESLQRAAQNVSATYGDIAKTKATAAEREALAKRQEQSRLDALAQRKEDVAYRDRQAALARANADRSFGLQQEAAKRAQEQYDYTIGKQKQKDRDAEILGALKVNVTKDALSPENRILLDTNKEAIEAVEGDYAKNVSNLLLRRNYINDKGEYSEAGKEFYNKRYNEYAKALSPQEAALRASNDVKMSREKALADNYDKKVENTLESLRASQDLNAAPTLEEFARAGVQQLTEGGEFSSPQAAYDALIKRGRSLGLSSRAEKAAANAAAEEKAYQRRKDLSKAYKDYYSITATKSKISDSGRYKGVNVKDFNEQIDDLGFIDRDQANQLYINATKDPRLQGVNPNIIREALLSGISSNFLSDKDININDKEVADRALALNSFRASKKGRVSDEEAQKILDALKPPEKENYNGRFALPNTSLSYNSRLPAINTEALKASLNRAVAGTSAAETPDVSADASVPGTFNEAVPESLRSLLEPGTLDLGEPRQRTIRASNPRGRDRVVTQFTPKQELSRELLDIQEAIDGITSGKITSYEGLGPLATKQLLDDIVRKRDRLLRNLRSINN